MCEVRWPPWQWRLPAIWGTKSTRAIGPGSGGAHYVSAISGNLVDDDLVGNAAQRRLFLNRRDRRLVQDRGHRGRVDHGSGDVDRLRGRQALNARGNVDGLAEIILPLVEHHRETRAFMDADLDHQIVPAAFGVELIHGGAHP